MSEFRWRLRHPAEGSAIEEWMLSRKRDRANSFQRANWSVRWYPRLKRWRVLEWKEKGPSSQKYMCATTIAEFPCDPLVMAFVGEEARAFAETTWRLKHGE